MGLIVKSLVVYGDHGSGRAEVLFDTGARSSAVRRDIAERFATPVRLRRAVVFGLASRSARAVSREAVLLGIGINGKVIDGRFYVVDDLRRDVILGADLLQNWSIRLDPRRERVDVGADPTNIELSDLVRPDPIGSLQHPPDLLHGAADHGPDASDGHARAARVFGIADSLDEHGAQKVRVPWVDGGDGGMEVEASSEEPLDAG